MYFIVKKECKLEICKNGGICIEIVIGRYFCICFVGFFGDDCEGG